MRPESVARPSGIESPRSYVARPRDGCDGTSTLRSCSRRMWRDEGLGVRFLIYQPAGCEGRRVWRRSCRFTVRPTVRGAGISWNWGCVSEVMTSSRWISPAMTTQPDWPRQERSDGYLLAHGGARFARSLVETGLNRRVPPSRPPGRPRRGRADLPPTAHHRADEHHRLSGGAVANVFAAHS
jgi:hypothetical protein